MDNGLQRVGVAHKEDFDSQYVVEQSRGRRGIIESGARHANPLPPLIRGSLGPRAAVMDKVLLLSIFRVF